MLIFLRERVPSLARTAFLIGLLLAYLVPVTLIASYGVRGHITGPVKAKKYEEMKEFEKEFGRLKAEFLSIKEDLSIKHPLESSGLVKTRMRIIATSLLNSFNASLQVFLFYVVIIFIEVLIFPLLTAYVLYKLGQAAIGRFSGRVTSSRKLGPPELSET